MLLFADDAKIECSFWQVEIAERIADGGALPAEWGHGYPVLLDKDGLTDGWPRPTGDAYRPTPPNGCGVPGGGGVLVALYLGREILVA